jgi:hypothetical protein
MPLTRPTTATTPLAAVPSHNSIGSEDNVITVPTAPNAEYMQMATMDSLDLAKKNHVLSNNPIISDETLHGSAIMSVCPNKSTKGILIRDATVLRTKDPNASLAGFVSIFPPFKVAVVITIAISHTSMTHLLVSGYNA